MTQAQPSFRERYAAAKEDILRKAEVKALMRTPIESEFVTMKVAGTKQLIAYLDRGWEEVAPLSLGRGAGWVEHIIRKPRVEL